MSVVPLGQMAGRYLSGQAAQENGSGRIRTQANGLYGPELQGSNGNVKTKIAITTTPIAIDAALT